MSRKIILEKYKKLLGFTNLTKVLVSYFIFLLRNYSEWGDIEYRYLWYLSFISPKKFLKNKTRIISTNKERIKQKGICKVGFVVHSVSMWTVDGLYHLFDSDNFYLPTVIVVPYAASDINQETFDFFVRKGYNVVRWDQPDFDIDSQDVIFYTHPYVANENNINILSLRLNKLISYVSYSYILSAKIEKIDMPVSILSWKFFCDSNFYKRLIETKSRVYTGNAVFCGYPKMDAYYYTHDNEKLSSDNRKIVIYAPHQSVNYPNVKSATFEMNGWFLLYLANKYKDRVFWIVKPHPLLRKHSVEAGLFTSEREYDDYLRSWEESGCGKVVENGDYMALFKESDAMITDSVSFLAEYQFTGKPLLLLESGKQTYNEFGNKIKEILYKCKGNDYSRIKLFIEDILVDKDPMKEIRNSFFKSHLNLTSDEGKLACDNLYAIFNSELKE